MWICCCCLPAAAVAAALVVAAIAAMVIEFLQIVSKQLDKGFDASALELVSVLAIAATYGARATAA